MFILKFTHAKTKKTKKSVHIDRCLTIGRGSFSDIELPDDETVSRLHSLVVPRPDDYLELRDLGSTTGTFVENRGERKMLCVDNGKKAKTGRAVLKPGDKFFVGKYTVEVDFEENVLGESRWRCSFRKAMTEFDHELKKEWDEITDFELLEDEE